MLMYYRCVLGISVGLFLKGFWIHFRFIAASVQAVQENHSPIVRMYAVKSLYGYVLVSKF